MEHSKKKIILIDDDPFILDMYVLKLKESPYEVETATNGKDGLEKIKSLHPDLALIDIVMPGMDGFEVLRALKKEPDTSSVKVILLTNLGQKEDVERGMQLGADDYIIKAHFTPTEVLNKIMALLPE